MITEGEVNTLLDKLEDLEDELTAAHNHEKDEEEESPWFMARWHLKSAVDRVRHLRKRFNKY